MAVIQDLVLTFCPTMHSVQQKKLKLLMPVLTNKMCRQISGNCIAEGLKSKISWGSMPPDPPLTTSCYFTLFSCYFVS